MKKQQSPNKKNLNLILFMLVNLILAFCSLLYFKPGILYTLDVVDVCILFFGFGFPSMYIIKKIYMYIVERRQDQKKEKERITVVIEFTWNRGPRLFIEASKKEPQKLLEASIKKEDKKIK